MAKSRSGGGLRQRKNSEDISGVGQYLSYPLCYRRGKNRTMKSYRSRAVRIVTRERRAEPCPSTAAETNDGRRVDRGAE